MQYRTHEDGPLTTIRIEPGAVVVEMFFDLPGSFTRMHAHSFDGTGVDFERTAVPLLAG